MSSYAASKLFDCSGLVAVITGGGSGLGAIAALALDANGAKAVYIVGRRKESLDRVVAQGKNGSIRAIVGDVTSKDSLAAAAAQVEQAEGYINVLVANSGVSGTARVPRLSKDFSVREYKELMWEPPMEDFTRTLEVNVTGVYYTVLAFLELLDAGNRQGSGSGSGSGSVAVAQKSQIVVTSSAAGVSRMMTIGMDYSTSKAAAVHLTKILATQFSRFKIRANVIAPGFYPSEMTAQLPVFNGQLDARKEGGVSKDISPLERAGSEDDFAGVFLSIVSPAGAYYDGMVFLTDGGRVSTMPAVY